MGSRSRAYKQAQFNQSFAQGQSRENRTFIPAPAGGVNKAVPAQNLPLQYAESGTRFIPTRIGLTAIKNGVKRTELAVGVGDITTLIPFAGSATASSKLFLHAGAANQIYDVTSFVDASATSVTASAAHLVVVSASVSPVRYGYTETNNNLILTPGTSTSAPALRYNNATGNFFEWSATASGDSIHNMWGINTFKSRIYCWEQDQPKFWYGSTDQIIGTLNPFDLSFLVGDSQYISTFFGMTRDGGSGPDDFATFVMNDGKVVVYQGSDPGDANDWSLVGVYQIGKPLGRRCAVPYGGETVVACTDDFYFLPTDLQGKRKPTKMVKDRTGDGYFNELDGSLFKKKGWVVWNDGTLINMRQNDRPGTFDVLPQTGPSGGLAPQGRFPLEFKDKFYFVNITGQDDGIVNEFQSDAAKNLGPLTLKTAPIPVNSRTNISLINPVMYSTGSNQIKYKTRVLWDFSASSDYTTATADGDSVGLWQPGFGTGTRAQIELTVISASVSTSADLYLAGFDLTLGETGGI